MEITKDMVDWEKYLSDHTDIEVCPPLDTWGAICESLNGDPDQINEEFALYLTDEAKAAVIEEYGPERCDLYYVDCRDSLDGRVDLQDECLQSNSLMPLSEKVFDWWDFPERYELDEIKRSMSNDGLEELFDELYEEFREWLWEHDESDPVKDLLRNTDDVAFFYSLGVEIGGWTEPRFLCESHRTSSEEDEVAKILNTLNLPPDHPSVKDIEVMVAQACYGGDLRIYFSANVGDLIAGDKYDSQSEDFKSVHIKGDVCVCITNAWNGSGDFCEVKGVDIVMPFERENLHISKIEKYSMEEVCGLVSNWTQSYDVPTFSMDPVHECATIAKSPTNTILTQEAEYNRVFQAGGCTYGDRDIRCHRDTYYRNDYPCGDVCPHCGTFWVD